MSVSSYYSKNLQVDDDVVKSLVAEVIGSSVQNMELWTSSGYSEIVDGIEYFRGSELYQELSLPGYFTVQMSNDHTLDGSDLLSSDPVMDANLAVYGADGEGAFDLQASTDDEIESQINEALDGIERTWDQSFGSGGESSGGIEYDDGTITLTIGYRLPNSASSNGVTCEWGYGFSTTKSIELYRV
ncbi:MAG: hypothetical protein HPY61_11125 [Methanotrichaceae archaeon]|nr:hypothetical protein [Methanotrichaceae archaeon]